ncbi:flagellar biosynthesis anti-sigma factor FlgM [Terracidiphilus gabretensis]|uniref:flagellar biosynthesis anti-sigma factor FlgM n=1 Tax=Terracidiphilus gabretensis TaxID=1577687 RepID=UPI0018D2443D|nr:flagellar biosynthesis anti-sigma factor FlgM [Terracidiphilus gabretensis]
MHHRAVSAGALTPIEPLRRKTVEIRNSLSGLNAISNPTPVSNQPETAPQSAHKNNQTMQNTDRATVSAAGAGISQSGPDSDVRWEKVTAIQQALAAGTYNVPASAVATKMVDSMLGKPS